MWKPVFFLLLAGLPLASLPVSAAPSPADTLKEKKAIAQTQHELMVMLIQKGEYSRIPDELQKVLDLNFSGPYEKYVTDEILILSNLLSRKKQPEMCLKVLDMGLANLKETGSRARLYKEKGAIYKLMNQPDKALEMFQKGLELEKASGGKSSG